MEIRLQQHWVEHESTIDANWEERIDLFVYEFDGRDEGVTGPVVLMLHGRSVPALVSFDLGGDSPYGNEYSWARILARMGFDVFVMDLQGSGLSPRPMMDERCNTDPNSQKKLTPPRSCPPNYGFQLSTSDSELDEVGTVVDYILRERQVEKIALVGWSAAAVTLGPFATKRPQNVESLFLLAPIFDPDAITHPPRLTRRPKPNPGVPMTIQTKNEFDDDWKKETNLGSKRMDGLIDIVWAQIMDNDDIGRNWGYVMRIRTVFRFGWNNITVKSGGILGSRVPVCIVYGTYDIQANTPPQPRNPSIHTAPKGSLTKPADVKANVGIRGRRDIVVTGEREEGPAITDPFVPPAEENPGPPFSVKALYRGIPGNHKIMIQVDDTGHFMPWEKASALLHDLSYEWINTRTIRDATHGFIHMTSDGQVVS